jgi:hypothetical protein
MVPSGYLLGIIGEKKQHDAFPKWNVHICSCFIFWNALQDFTFYKCISKYPKKSLEGFYRWGKIWSQITPLFEGRNRKDVGLKARGDALEQASLT